MKIWKIVAECGLAVGASGHEPEVRAATVTALASEAHLILSALRHRARELGERAVVLQTETYRQALELLGEPVEVCAPTSHAAREFVQRLKSVTVLPERAFVTTRTSSRGGSRLATAAVCCWRTATVTRGAACASSWTAINRLAGRGTTTTRTASLRRGLDHLPVAPPWSPEEDDIDEQVRADLNRWERDAEVAFVGADGPRWSAATIPEAQQAFAWFVAERLPTFGRWEDAMLASDWSMSHSVLSPALNLGLLDRVACVRAAENAYALGRAPLSSVEGYIRQVMGWRDYVWHIYWHLGPQYRKRNALEAHASVPVWLWELDAERVTANRLRTVLQQVRDRGCVHYIPRLMVLGNWALPRAIDPDELTSWFHRSFVDGYDWVMAPKVVGTSQHADGGLMATKPYAAGGAYIDRMSDFCRDCAFDPRVRAGPDACPYSAGYWAFLDRTAGHLGREQSQITRGNGHRACCSDGAHSTGQQRPTSLTASTN